MHRRSFLKTGLATALALGVHLGKSCLADASEGELLYNGIRLPRVWPPQLREVPSEPVTPAYLVSPPSVIPIDIGRQLFVDDFLIEQTTLKRTFHLATYHPGPVLQPDKPWEKARAMAYSDGVWYDPKDKIFKMWYFAGDGTAYATSPDGIKWEKPVLDVVPGANMVHTGKRDSATVWLDLEEKDPKRRYKLFRSCSGGSTIPGTYGVAMNFSEDGIHWTEPPVLSGSCGDRTTVFYNPFRKVWVYSLRHGWGRPRRRRYWETNDLLTGKKWLKIDQPPMWAGADKLDPVREDLKAPNELYNLDAVAYESLMLGLFTIYRGISNFRDKPNEVCLGYSRDGWSWSRPDRRAFCPVSEKDEDWNYINVQSVGGGCVIIGDKLHFYVSGRSRTGTKKPGEPLVSVTGLATLRRDGFASMDAANSEGTLTTRAVTFRGRHAFVNVNAPKGELRAEILDKDGKAIEPFTLANCVPVRADKTIQALKWKGAEDLSAAAGKPVKLRFSLKKGELYAFWMSPESSGASQGYVAGGGPGFLAATDTVGERT